MSYESRGEGWWLASDGKWYPPSEVPASAAPAPPRPAPPTRAPEAPAATVPPVPVEPTLASPAATDAAPAAATPVAPPTDVSTSPGAASRLVPDLPDEPVAPPTRSIWAPPAEAEAGPVEEPTVSFTPIESRPEAPASAATPSAEDVWLGTAAAPLEGEGAAEAAEGEEPPPGPLDAKARRRNRGVFIAAIVGALLLVAAAAYALTRGGGSSDTTATSASRSTTTIAAAPTSASSSSATTTTVPASSGGPATTVAGAGNAAAAEQLAAAQAALLKPSDVGTGFAPQAQPSELPLPCDSKVVDEIVKPFGSASVDLEKDSSIAVVQFSKVYTSEADAKTAFAAYQAGHDCGSGTYQDGTVNVTFEGAPTPGGFAADDAFTADGRLTSAATAPASDSSSGGIDFTAEFVAVRVKTVVMYFQFLSTSDADTTGVTAPNQVVTTAINNLTG